MKRFVLFGAARSGTTLVTSTLNDHPEVVCHGEIFHHAAPERHLVNGLDALDLSALDRFSEPYMERVFQSGAGAKAVGFKMWRSQAAKIADRLLADDSVDKIIMERTNLLALYSSVMLARQTHVWNVDAGQPAPKKLRDAEIAFEADGFEQICANRAELFGRYRQEARGRMFELTYEDVTKDGFDGLLEFLGVESLPLAPAKAKLYGSDIIARFTAETRGAARDAIEALGHPEWAVEGAT